MEKTNERAAEILNRAEEELRSLIAEAANKGDYPIVVGLTRIAERLRELQEGVDAASADSTETSSTPDTGVEPRKRRKRRSSTGGKVKRGGYPRFERRSDYLCRVGWSKKSRSEYEHKISQTAYNQVVSAMAALSSRGKKSLTADQIAEQLSQAAADEIPAYQVYVVIGFLRHSGLVEKKGRDGYEVKVHANFEARARGLWNTTGGEL